MPNTALITGASSGIGREFARYHAARGGDLVITARREAELEALKDEIENRHDVTVHVIALDLGASGGAEALIERVDALGVDIDVLINNAGFGGQGMFIERDIASDLAMIDLNVRALVTLSHHFGSKMLARGQGKMLQVSSTASYVPGPFQATYYATKAFVSSFSQAIDQEMRDRGVTSTALEPGLVETEFVATAGLEGTNISQVNGASPQSVAKYGYDAMLAGRLRAVNEPSRRIQLQWLVPLLPYRMVLRMIESFQK